MVSVENLVKYVMVLNYTGEKDVYSAFLLLRDAIKDKTGVLPFPYFTDSIPSVQEADADAYEILIGETNRAESIEAARGLSELDYVIRITGKKIIIVGGSQYGTIKGIYSFIENYLKEDRIEGNADHLYTHKYPLKSLTIDGIDIGQYRIAMGIGCDNEAFRIRNAVLELIGADLEIIPAAKASEYSPVILVGHASDTKELERIGLSEYAVLSTDSGIIIGTQLDVLPVSDAVSLFISKALGYDENAEKGKYGKSQYTGRRELKNLSLSGEFDLTIMKEEEVLEAYRIETDAKIKNILTSGSSVAPAGNGTAYYVSASGNDNNNGLSPDTAWESLDKVNTFILKEGDVVCFQRGDTFRGCFNAQNGVSYSAYGNGDKPVITTSPYNAAETGEWIPTDIPNIYKFSLPVGNEVGLIVMNDGEYYTTKICPAYIDGKPAYDYASKISFASYADLPEDMYFFHDFGGPVFKAGDGAGWIYLYSSEGNPSERFDRIEFNVDLQKGTVRCRNNNVFDNLCFRYGCYGISTGVSYAADLTVQNCEFSWLGGSIFLYRDGGGYLYPVRYGNGVEIYGSCDGFRVFDCYFYQIYDAAISPQRNANNKTEATEMLNIEYCRNVIEYCQWGVEYWITIAKNDKNFDATRMENFLIAGNYMWYSGYGVCEQRPNRNCAAHIMSMNHENPCSGNFIIRNNTFAFGIDMLAVSLSSIDSILPEYDGNIYIQYIGKDLGRYAANTSSGKYQTYPFNPDTAKDTIRDIFGDKNATVIFVSD
ncbi:MAG: hypothetical protein PHG48_01465 [Eubacteriales bacterium]|nr:hypothetical protein [Eubacteriales bacterium]